MFKKPTQGYSRQMNDNLVPAEAEGYTFQFGISRTTLRIVGLCSVVAATVLTVLINATEPFRIPLGITLGAVAITLLAAYAVSSSARARKLKPARNESTRERQAVFGKITGRKSLAAELALLSELHRSGELSDEEFSVAKRRTLDGK